MPANIRITPLGDIDSDVLEHVRAALRETFGAEVYITAAQPAPKYAFSAYVHQFSAPTVVHKLAATIPEPSAKVLGVTSFDLFAPRTNYVFGEAQMGGGAAVISLYRLLERDRSLYYARAGKEAIHEIGHTFGLDHCHEPGCVMHFSHTIEDTDQKSGKFCAKCQRLLDKAMEE